MCRYCIIQLAAGRPIPNNRENALQLGYSNNEWYLLFETARYILQRRRM